MNFRLILAVYKDIGTPITNTMVLNVDARLSVPVYPKYRGIRIKPPQTAKDENNNAVPTIKKNAGLFVPTNFKPP